MELLPVKISVYRPVPLMGYSVHAGFPSPADDHLNNQLDIAEFMVTRPGRDLLCHRRRRLHGRCRNYARRQAGGGPLVETPTGLHHRRRARW